MNIIPSVKDSVINFIKNLESINNKEREILLKKLF